MIPLPQKIKLIDKKENKACFEIEGLYPGYGITVGNSLRRVLLSSLEGAAVTQVKIRGIQHEFSTISGVMEDVIRILMNLKNMRFRMYSDEPQKAFLKIKGVEKGKKERKVKGSDFEFPSQVELVNKDCHIATITKKDTELEMEIQIEKGIGYRPVEDVKKQKKTETGVIFVDAIFTPIKKVNYRVENMRVGERTDFDRLRIEITTDGTLTPEEAFVSACDILVAHFSLFSNSFKREEKGENEKKGKKRKASSSKNDK